MYIAANCCSQRDKVALLFSVLPYITFTVQILYTLYSQQLNCTYSNYTEAASTCSACYRTAYLLYKYCKHSTVSNWTVLTVITQKLLLHVQRVPYSTFTVQILYILYIQQLNYTYINCTEAASTYSACYRTAHILYKYSTYSTFSNWTVLTLIAQKLLLHVQLNSNSVSLNLTSCVVQCNRMFDIV